LNGTIIFYGTPILACIPAILISKMRSTDSFEFLKNVLFYWFALAAGWWILTCIVLMFG